MEKQIEACPWCHREVQVEAGRQRLYSCPFCKKEFTFTPAPLRRRVSHQPSDPG